MNLNVNKIEEIMLVPFMLFIITLLIIASCIIMILPMINGVLKSKARNLVHRIKIRIQR